VKNRLRLIEKRTRLALCLAVMALLISSASLVILLSTEQWVLRYADKFTSAWKDYLLVAWVAGIPVSMFLNYRRDVLSGDLIIIIRSVFWPYISVVWAYRAYRYGVDSVTRWIKAWWQVTDVKYAWPIALVVLVALIMNLGSD
jgi:hypothetical protein